MPVMSRGVGGVPWGATARLAPQLRHLLDV